MDGHIHALEIVLLLLLTFVVAFAALARKLKTPYPIVLVIAGLVLGFIPGIPEFHLNPEAIFLVVLPPLLYSAAWVTSWRDFVFHLTSISMLAFGLVAFTVFGIAFAAPHIFPGFTWQLGFVLGAVVSTTDAIAATSIARRVGLPRTIVDILEGESLINDASGLLALEFGVAMLMRGQIPSASEALLRLSYLIAAGLAIGLIIGKFVEWFEHHIEDGPIEIAFSLLVPYAAYLAADTIRGSGVLAVVACGLYLSRKSARFFSPQVRLQTWAFWNSFTFILNGLVFVLIGLQLRYVLAGIREISLRQAIVYGLIFSAIVIALRLLWTYPGARVSWLIRTRLLHQRYKCPPARQTFVVGWTGMRGVIALAAALSLPERLANGDPFPQRSLIIFLTFIVIFVTLVLQGLTLPWVIRKLGLAQAAGPNCEEREARRIIAQTVLDRIQEARAQDRPEFAPIYEDLHHHYSHRLVAARTGQETESDDISAHILRAQDLSLELLRTERETALALRSEGRINDDVLRTLEYELDLRESQLAPAAEDAA